MTNAAIAAALGFGLVLLLLFITTVIRLKWKIFKNEPDCTPYTPVQLVHRLCPHNNVVQGYEVEQKDSLDAHLDVLTRKLAEKEGRLRLSKMKIRETQNEIDGLHAIDQSVRSKYREIMDSLKTDLTSNERECRKLQEQIEWVSRRRAQLKVEVTRGQKLYGDAATELACNLAEMHRTDRVVDKPCSPSSMSLRFRMEPQLPRASPVGSLLMKTPSTSPTPPASKYKSSEQIVS